MCYEAAVITCTLCDQMHVWTGGLDRNITWPEPIHITSYNDILIFQETDSATPNETTYYTHAYNYKGKALLTVAKQRKWTQTASRAPARGSKAERTDTQGLELVLGVGDRCTVTSAIQRAGNTHLRHGSGDTRIMLMRSSWAQAVFLLSQDCFLSRPRRTHAHQPIAVNSD